MVDMAESLIVDKAYDEAIDLLQYAQNGFGCSKKCKTLIGTAKLSSGKYSDALWACKEVR